MNAAPEVVYTYIDPDPKGKRNQWDKAVKELEVVEDIDKVSTRLHQTIHWSVVYGSILHVPFDYKSWQT